MSVHVGVIDTHVCNMASVYDGLSLTGANVSIIEKASAMHSMTHLVLPGVGCFSSAMEHLRQKGLDEAIIRHVQKQRPVLGICLGMHLLAECSEEYGNTDGLALFQGKTTQLKVSDESVIPHMGWNEVHFEGQNLFHEIDSGELFYFAHSFCFEPKRPPEYEAVTHYGGTSFLSSFSQEHIHAVQFHPEKSGAAGTQLLRNFITLC